MEGEKTVSEKIYSELYREIISHKLKPGQNLTLAMLRKRFNVSHTPIREALTQLSSDGLVSYESNKGMKVIKFTDSEIREIFQFTAELEVLAMRFCSSAFTMAPLLNEMKTIISQEENALENNDIESWNKVSGIFHGLFYKYSGNRFLNEAAERMGARMELMSNMYSPKDYDISVSITNRQREIYEAVDAGEFDRAADLIRAHLQFSMIDVLELSRSDD